MIFVPTQNEKFYDLCGAVGWALATFISLYYPALKAKFWDRIPGAEIPPLSLFSERQLLATAVLGLWTLRLGIFLTRVSISEYILQWLCGQARRTRSLTLRQRVALMIYRDPFVTEAIRASMERRRAHSHSQPFGSLKVIIRPSLLKQALIRFSDMDNNRRPSFLPP